MCVPKKKQRAAVLPLCGSLLRAPKRSCEAEKRVKRRKKKEVELASSCRGPSCSDLERLYGAARPAAGIGSELTHRHRKSELTHCHR